jgi:predicted RNA-binding protein Jag
MPEQDMTRVNQLLQEAEEKLADSMEAVHLDDLSPAERKHVHEFFEHKLDFETKTYRDGEKHVLWVFPVGNLKKFAMAKANEAVESGEILALKPMSNYERFIIHDALKDVESVETSSEGEGAERHVVISPAKFGRRLKRIVKKIKLF